METAKHQAREAQQEIPGLKARLARALGEEAAADHPEHSLASAAVTDLHAQVQRLVGELGESRGRLRDTEEELEAARRLNRTLIRGRNATPPRSSREVSTLVAGQHPNQHLGE